MRPEKAEHIKEEKLPDIEIKDMDMAETKPKKKEIKFIENPLPLPKKHVRKLMDYRFEPGPELMKYDIEVKENDDFDLK